ncbi:uncharacterized protein RHO25_006733, partial [Cercospora beticola]
TEILKRSGKILSSAGPVRNLYNGIQSGQRRAFMVVNPFWSALGKPNQLRNNANA